MITIYNIISFGSNEFPLKLKKTLKRKSNDSFDAHIQVDINELPKIKGWTAIPETATGIEMTGFVKPHVDPYKGSGDCNSHRSLFWFLSNTAKDDSFLMVGNEAIRMLPNDWVFFDDSVLHSFMSNGRWIGLTIQYIR